MTIEYRLQIVDYNYWISLRDFIFSFTCGVIKPRGLPTQAFRFFVSFIQFIKDVVTFRVQGDTVSWQSLIGFIMNVAKFQVQEGTLTIYIYTRIRVKLYMLSLSLYICMMIIYIRIYKTYMFFVGLCGS